MKKTPLVSIVIPCFNAKKILRGCLTSVLATKYSNFEVIIVDDQSKDGSFEYLMKHYSKNPKMKIMRNEKNFGPSVTRNNGIREAKGKYIAFIETDMETDPNWLTPLVNTLEKDKSLGAVQSRTLDINRRDLIHSMGAKFNPHTFWVISPECGLNREWIPESPETSIGAVGSVVRTEVIEKIGGYDQVLVHNIDDIDLGWRIWLGGYRIISVPESITYHWTAKPFKVREKATPKFSSEFHFYKGHRLILKNYEFKNIVRYLPWQIFAYLLNITRNILLGNFVPLRAYLKALWWNVVNLKDTLEHRSKIQHLRKMTDEEMFAKHGLPGSFFKFYFGTMIKNLLMVRRVFVNGHGKKSTKVRCLVCTMPLYTELYSRIKVGAKYSYLVCPHCSTGNLIPRPTQSQINKYYERQQYFKGLSSKLTNPIFQWLITRRIHNTPSEWVKKNFKSGKILDIGCGNGEFLGELKNNGWEASGVDISSIARQNTEKLIGQGKVKVGEFSKLKFKEKFDYISFWHVLEHLVNPQEYFDKAFNVLSQKGKIVGEIPNFDSLVLRVFKSNYSWVMVPAHLSYLSKSSLRRLAKKAGFRKISFYSPPRALLNFALSMGRYLKYSKWPFLLRGFAVILVSPVSILFVLASSLIESGEVIRFVAEK